MACIEAMQDYNIDIFDNINIFKENDKYFQVHAFKLPFYEIWSFLV